MIKGLKWTAGCAGLVLVAVAPYLWFSHADLLWLVVPLICIWAFWLMLEYLRWAKTLGRK